MLGSLSVPLIGIDATDCQIVALRTNYVLIDLENVQADSLGLLAGGPFKVKVFVGSNQKKVSLTMVQAVQLLGADAEYIQIDGHGKNALDFHIAYYIGRLAVESAGAFLHIISNDTGFGPLISHLRSNQIFCLRSSAIEDIPLVRAMNAKSLPERAAVLLDALKRRPKAGPQALKTFNSWARRQFGGTITDDDLEKVISMLAKQGAITIQDGKVSRSLPE